MRQRECMAMNGGRDESLRPAVAVVAIPLLVGRPIMLDLEHKPISLLNKKKHKWQSIIYKKLQYKKGYSIWNLLKITFNNVRDGRYLIFADIRYADIFQIILSDCRCRHIFHLVLSKKTHLLEIINLKFFLFNECTMKASPYRHLPQCIQAGSGNPTAKKNYIKHLTNR